MAKSKTAGKTAATKGAAEAEVLTTTELVVLAKKRLPSGREQILFSSGDDLVRKTPGFYRNAAKRLDLQLARAYEYAGRHFKGQNLYLEEMQKNVRYAKAVGDAPTGSLLRRQ